MGVVGEHWRGLGRKWLFLTQFLIYGRPFVFGLSLLIGINLEVSAMDALERRRIY